MIEFVTILLIFSSGAWLAVYCLPVLQIYHAITRMSIVMCDNLYKTIALTEVISYNYKYDIRYKNTSTVLYSAINIPHCKYILSGLCLYDIIYSMSISKNKTPRAYNRITAATVAKHQALEIKHGNGSAAVRITNPELLNEGERAFRIRKKSKQIDALQYIDDSLQQISSEAVQELGELVHSDDARLRLKAVTYAIDHVRGKAVQKSVSITGKSNIQNVLD